MIIGLLCDILDDLEQSKASVMASTSEPEHKLLSDIKPFNRFQEIVNKLERKLMLLKQYQSEVEGCSDLEE